ncbi:MAG: hypothetical protein UZ17_ACD001000963 [Acidobacteria bacterium OLB17]|nr:MAG: hypothetical protein UZ17_ACD001000963 [Acidobacteria bacterium OLB17]MCZ2390071.1 hypothetical protein [Acidobacteriota bacterium]
MMVDRVNRELKRPLENSIPLNKAHSEPSAQSRNDDVIASLADMRENRRARQVYEWETMRRRMFKLSL